MNTRSARIQWAVLCSFLSSSLLSAAVAPTVETSTVKAEEKITLDKFVVTGSLIPVAAGQTAVPITTLGIPEIERTGISTDLVDVLRSSQPQFYGANNLGSDVANTNSGDTNGGSGLALLDTIG